MIEKIERIKAGIIRVWPWLLASFILLVAIYWVRPMQIENVASKMVNITIGGVMAYWLDRTLFRHFEGVSTLVTGDVLSAARTLARAVVAAACVLGMCLAI